MRARIAGFLIGVAITLVVAVTYVVAGQSSVVDAFAYLACWSLSAALILVACRQAVKLERARIELAAAIDARSAIEDRFKAETGRLRVAVNNMSQGLCMFGPDRRLILSNTRYADLYRIPHELVRPGMTLAEILDHRIAAGNVPAMGREEYSAMMAEVGERRVPTELIIEQEDGRVFQLGYVPLSDGGWVATHQDITDRRIAEAKIAHMVRHDSLTNLPNRVAFREQLDHSLARVKRGESLAVLCLDLDRFKGVNDTLGHHIGDMLLLEVAKRLKGCVRESDAVARLSGDEFAVIQIGVRQPAEATALARRLVETMAAPYELDGHQVVVGASVGIAIAPNDGEEVDRLMKSADMALYRAKIDGRATYRFFEAEMDARMQARRALESDLRQAIVEKEFVLHYQSIVNVETEEIDGFEALIRWRHPERGLVSPADFIPIAEETGLIVPLGEWVIRQACADAASWPAPIKVAVNLSPVQIRNANLVPIVISALANSGLSPRRLELEITETVLLQDSEATLATLHQLQDLGARISMDDFGTGYSSLSYLRKFPFDKIKIDRSFIRDLSEHEDSIAIVRAVSALGKSLGMATIAEGVETAEQLERVRLEGCTEVQGYFFSPPKPAEEIARILAEHLPRARQVA